MDERALSLLFLLMAGVLPLRGLTSQWADRPDRRGAVRLLWAAYTLTAVGAVLALILMIRSEDRSRPPPSDGPEQFALHARTGSGISAG